MLIRHIHPQREADARQSLIDQRAALYLDSSVDPYTRQETIAEIDATLTEMDAIDPVAANAEAEQARLEEWASYKDMETETVEMDATEVAITEETAARGWLKRIAKSISKVIIRPVCSILSSPARNVAGVSGSPTLGYWSYALDWWSNRITLNNNANHCVPISAAMILNYHHIRKGKGSLYHWNRLAMSRLHAATSGIPVEVKLATALGTTTDGTQDTHLGRNWYDSISQIFQAYGLSVTGTSVQHLLSPTKNTRFAQIKWRISQNQPIVYTTHDFGGWIYVSGIAVKKVKAHAMPVIGYKNEVFSNVCRLMGYRERKWLLVDTTWYGYREYMRFDNYFLNDSSLTYLWVQ
ncbi:MAG: hypothetical protein AUK35_11025 [Zetaproteobacteria bacterium CG2_30_46_52]|nr:MAG: hypothetical protein AUK35_11025 [Zetaproteobacteria bacterium CG2_30_46_52]